MVGVDSGMSHTLLEGQGDGPSAHLNSRGCPCNIGGGVGDRRCWVLIQECLTLEGQGDGPSAHLMNSQGCPCNIGGGVGDRQWYVRVIIWARGDALSNPLIAVMASQHQGLSR